MKIKDTKSLCPVCFKSLDAEVFEEDDKIWIQKECPEHGVFKNTYWSDAETYHRVKKYIPADTSVKNPIINKSGDCPNNCGICQDHNTTTVLGLIDVTNRCNLRCPVCFANAAVSGKLFEPTQDEIRQMLKNLRNLKPHPTSAIQYAGGEPTVRKDLVDLVKMAKEEGFTHVQIATNGLRLARKPEWVKELREAGLNTVYLAFDGVTPEPYIHSRGKDLLNQKIQAIENCRKVGLGVVLVPTLIKGVNDDQVGDIIKFAFDNRDIVYGVNFQPVSFAGRTPADQVEEERVTIPDFINLVAEQTDNQVVPENFYPPSAMDAISEFVEAYEDGEPTVNLNCHEHCGIATYVFLDKDEEGNEKYIPINDFIDVDGFLELMSKDAERLNEGGVGIKARVLAGLAKNIPKLIDKDAKPADLEIGKILLKVFKDRSYDALGDFSKDAMLIACMHFMDPFNFDQDRVQNCVIHYAVPDGRIIPFCTYNSIHRESVEEKFSTPLKKPKKE